MKIRGRLRAFSVGLKICTMAGTCLPVQWFRGAALCLNISEERPSRLAAGHNCVETSVSQELSRLGTSSHSAARAGTNPGIGMAKVPCLAHTTEDIENKVSCPGRCLLRDCSENIVVRFPVISNHAS